MTLKSILAGSGTQYVVAARLLAVVLSLPVLAMAHDESSLLIIVIWAGYLLLQWLLASRFSPAGDWRALAVSAADVAVVSAAIGFTPGTASSLWPLYVLPLVGAAPNGAWAVLAATFMAAAAYIAVSWPPTVEAAFTLGWPVAFLCASAVVVIILSRRWVVERNSRRIWQEAAVLAGSFWDGDEPEEVALALVTAAAKLARTQYGWIWRTRQDGAVSFYASTPSAPEAPPMPAAAAALGRAASVPYFLDTGSGPRQLRGELFGVRQAHSLEAVIGLVWERQPADLEVRRAAVRSLCPSVALALLQAEARRHLREQLRLERSMASIASELAVLDGSQTAMDSVEAEIRRTLEVEIDSEEAEGVRFRPVATVEASPDRAGLRLYRGERSLTGIETDWASRLGTLSHRVILRCMQHEAIVATERRLRSALENLPAPLVLWDRDRRKSLANAAYRSISALGDRRQLEFPGGLPEQEIAVGNPSRTFVATTETLPSQDAWVTLYREITREREALKAKDALIAMAGHELRSPLTSISGYSQMMARQLAVVQRQISQLDQLIGDFVEASSFGDGQLSLDMESVDLADLARSACDRFGGAHPTRPLKLDAVGTPLVQGDPARLAQVFDNLLSNADKYSPREESEIALRVEASEDHAMISVYDHGVGIEQEHLAMLFERYYRVRTKETLGVKGLGLGLSIVRDLVAAHGGTVWAESPGAGKGSTFHVWLPASGVQKAAEEVKEAV
ncbi:MAG TPA: HAMP domain-containing sensor histidine kinase [Chloroflexota bacterium]